MQNGSCPVATQEQQDTTDGRAAGSLVTAVLCQQKSLWLQSLYLKAPVQANDPLLSQNCPWQQGPLQSVFPSTGNLPHKEQSTCPASVNKNCIG